MGKHIINDFIALDVETSGLNFRTDQIIEVCVIRVRDGETAMIFNTLVRPSEDLLKTGLNPKVTEVTGHTIEDLMGGITEEDLASLLTVMLRPDSNAFVDSTLLIAYNALFDLSFIDSLFVKYGYDPVDNDFIDPLTIARDRSTYPHKLIDMCRKMGIELEDAHNAYSDTLALVELFVAMNDEDNKYKDKPVVWYGNKAGYKRKYDVPDWVPDYAELYPQGPKPDLVTKKPRTTRAPKPETYNKVVTNNAAKRKKRPDYANMPTEEFAQEYLPTKMLRRNVALERVKTLIEDPFSSYHLGMYVEVCITDVGTKEAEENYADVVHYLVTEAHIPEKDIITSQYTSSEVNIEFRKPGTRNYTRVDEDPFAPHKGPIEISEDDLPF